MSASTDIDALQAVKDLIAERDRLRRQVADLQQELDRLRAEAANERARLTAERDGYRRDVSALLSKEMPDFTEHDIAEWQRTGLPLEDFIHEIEEIVEKGPADGANH
jgi:hypothetical protein